MGRKPKIQSTVKIEAIEDYLSGKRSIAEICSSLSVSPTTVYDWQIVYRNAGASGLITSPHNNNYSKDLKMLAIEEYLEGKGSSRFIAEKYGLRSHKQLLAWLKKYNSHEKIKPSYSGGTLMTKSRKTTLDERIEIVKHNIENNKNHKDTSKKFGVSYQQVRNWTLKYEEHGLEGLKDRRGKKKTVEEMTENEKLRAELKLLEAKNKRLEMENIVLKKLEEIKRRRR